MRIAILQLSDIHIRDSRNAALDSGEKIASAVRSCIPLPDFALLLYTGDIAFSGKDEEYAIADKFCSALKHCFDKEGIRCSEIFIPGNHDLDLGSDVDDLRDMANSKVKEDIASILPTSSLAKRLLEQQAAFFKFIAHRGHGSFDATQRLFRKQRISEPRFTIDVNLFNTAFTSTLDEKPGTLVFPDHIIPPDISTDADLVISALHHPLHWLEPVNARRLRRIVESGCDLIFTGHEHLPDAYIKLRTKEEQAFYIEGAALCDPPTKSAFNAVEVDLISRRVQVNECAWERDMYVPSQTREFPLVRHIQSAGSRFRNSSDFARWLEDPGTLYTHPHKKELHLTDFFVQPSLRTRRTDTTAVYIDSVDSMKFLRDQKRAAILGEEGSGKTALAKMLYRHFLSDSAVVPIYIPGEEFDSVGEKNLRSLVRRVFTTQYGDADVERYMQLPVGEKAIIVDDFHKARFNDRGRARLMRQLKLMFGHVVCFASDLLSLEKVTTGGETEPAFGDFEHCSLPEFGVRLRGKLIEKWHVMGQELTITEDDVAYRVRQSENRINSILEKNFLPSFPFVVLTLLQADATQGGNANLGSYGHLYELLITRRLGESSDKLTDLGTKYTYISRLAYFMFVSDKAHISSAEMADVHEQYCQDYGQKLDLSKMLRELVQAQIITRDGDTIRFKYRACYCYFVAKYFQENLASDEKLLREQLLTIADRVYFEDYANIIIFFVFLTKDPAIIKEIVDNANKIYAELKPCNFTSDVDFFNTLLKETPKKLIETTSTSENREEFRRSQDEEEARLELSPAHRANKIVYDRSLADVQKISMAFTNLRILGHILRNFTGVLRKEPKKQLAHASYSVALRVMKRVIDLIVENIDTFRLQLAEVVKLQHAVKAKDQYDLVSDDDLKRRADEALISLTRGVGYSILKRVSVNLGSEDLAITYDDIKKEWGKEDEAVRLMDLAIKLDHFREAPKAEIEELAKVFVKNPYSFTVLQDLVAEYLYLNVSDQITQQKIGALVNINVTGKPSFLLNKKKALASKN